MTIAAYFHPKGMNLEQFKEIHRRLDEGGHGDQPHRLHHSCFGPEDELMVYDVWDSQEAFDAFGAVLNPILGDVGVEMGDVHVMPLHKLQQTAALE